MENEEEKKHYQAEIASLQRQLKDTQDALNKAQTANRHLMQDNQNLRYKFQDITAGLNPHHDQRIKKPTKE